MGYLTIVFEDHYIRKIEFGKGEPGPDVQQREAYPLLLQAETQLLEYVNGKRRDFMLLLAACGMPFQRNTLQQIPYGKTITYGQLVKMIDRPNAARAVGGGCNKNPIVIAISHHRMIDVNGTLTGFAGGITIKERLLALEQTYLIK